MKIRILAVGTRMPAWVNDAFEIYARRMPRECRVELQEIQTGHRARSADVAKAKATEGDRMLAALSRSKRVIALDVGGKMYDTPGLSRSLDAWAHDGRDIALLVGGPDGLAASCLERAESRWSLSPLTLPHGLVRVVLAEQIYRAWSLLRGHPYHRA
ncbi:MAG: 23S rRNA (pseudouridine(1915)-N(3))-methyltransferase RlmH [Gammaproteobacteria bacterium]